MIKHKAARAYSTDNNIYFFNVIFASLDVIARAWVADPAEKRKQKRKEEMNVI
jgi:hypothetical protein